MSRAKIWQVPMLILSASLLSANAWAQPQVDPRIQEMLSDYGSARIVVTMAPPTNAVSGVSAFEGPAAFIKGALGSEAQHVARVGVLPMAVAEVSPTGVEQLKQSPFVASLYADVPERYALDTSLATMNVPPVHDRGILGADYALAILDTGVDYTHEFLTGALAAEGCFSGGAIESGVYDVRSLCPNGLDVDLTEGAGRECDPNQEGCDHGTHVAGIALGRRLGLSGVAPESALISLQVFSVFDDESSCHPYAPPCILTFPSDQIRALRHVQDLAEDGMQIAAVNMSIGSRKLHRRACDNIDPRTLVINELRKAGIATVVASGNTAQYDAVTAPGCISSAITVAASKREGIEPNISLSNLAPVVDFLAPGTQITSSRAAAGYVTLSGTSMAAPHIAGAIGLLRAQSPSASVIQIESALRITAQKTTDPRTGMELRFPNVSAASEVIAIVNIDLVPEVMHTIDANVAHIVGATRLIIVPSWAMEVNPAAHERILERVENSFGESLRLAAHGPDRLIAEYEAGFTEPDLAYLLKEFGPQSRFYNDTPEGLF